MNTDNSTTQNEIAQNWWRGIGKSTRKQLMDKYFPAEPQDYSFEPQIEHIYLQEHTTENALPDYMEWWNGLKNFDNDNRINRISLMAKHCGEGTPGWYPNRPTKNLTLNEIEFIYKAEHTPPPPVKEDSLHTSGGTWFWNSIDGDNAICDDNGFVLEAPDEETGRRIVTCVNGYDAMLKAFNNHTSILQDNAQLKEDISGLKQSNDALVSSLKECLPYMATQLHREVVLDAYTKAKELLNNL